MCGSRLGLEHIDKLPHSLQAFNTLEVHGSLNNIYSVPAHTTSFKFSRRQTVVHHTCGVRRSQTRQNLVESGTESIDVESRRKLTLVHSVELFERSITRSAQSGGGVRRRTVSLLILLRQSEIDDKQLSVTLAPHHVARLKVAVQHPLRVHVVQSTGNTHNIIHSLSLRHTVHRPGIAVEVLAVNILHHIVERVVGIKTVEHLHNVRVLHGRQVHSLGTELAGILLNQRTGLDTPHQTIVVPRVEVRHVKLLDSHLHLSVYFSHRTLHLQVRGGKISDTVRACAQNPLYRVSICVAPKLGTCLQCLYNVILFH